MRPNNLRLAAPIVAPLVALVALTTLAACTNDAEELAPQCPIVSLVPDAASVSRYRDTGRDLTDLVLSVRLINVGGNCRGTMGKPTLAAHAQVQMLVTRGPAAQGRTADVVYGVGIVKDGAVIDRREITEHVAFPTNADSVQVTGDPISFIFPTRGNVTGPQYHIYYWLRLTPEEVAANRRGH